MKVLVTGGAGYIGSTLVPYLLAGGHQVRVLDKLSYGGESLLGVWAHPQFEFRRGDIRDQQTVRQAVEGMDAVVHLAAIVGDPACAREPELAKSVNLDASLQLLSEAGSAGVSRFLFASTCSNYGKMADTDGYVDESSQLAPVSLYAETKVAVECAALKAAREGRLKTTCLRFATVYGVSPRMRFDLTVNEFTRELLCRKHLVVFGERFWRPYVHVRDIARSVELVLSSPDERVAGQVFNVGATPENFQKQQIVDLIRPSVPDAVIEYVHRQEDPRDYRVSFDKIRHELGFTNSRTVQNGISEIIQLIGAGVLPDLDSAAYKN